MSIFFSQFGRRTVLAVLLAGGVAAYLVKGFSAQPINKQVIVASPSWLVRFSDLTPMARAADLIVIGTVNSIQPGRIVLSEDRSITTPFSNVKISVEQLVTASGVQPYKDLITVEQTGGETETFVLRVIEDPPYRVGERYLLFLLRKRDDPSLYIILSPEGRFLIRRGGIEPKAQTNKTFTSNSLDELLRKTVAALQ